MNPPNSSYQQWANSVNSTNVWDRLTGETHTTYLIRLDNPPPVVIQNQYTIRVQNRPISTASTVTPTPIYQLPTVTHTPSISRDYFAPLNSSYNRNSPLRFNSASSPAPTQSLHIPLQSAPLQNSLKSMPSPVSTPSCSSSLGNNSSSSVLNNTTQINPSFPERSVRAITNTTRNILRNITVPLYSPATTCQCVYQYLGESHHKVCIMHKKGLTYGSIERNVTIALYEPGNTCQCIYEYLGEPHRKACASPLI